MVSHVDGSTEHVFKVTLPQLAEMDGLLKPTTIPFEVPAIPKLKSIQTGASKKAAAKGGNALKPLPALERARVAEPDSSDEEEERLLALGQQGK